MSAKILAMPETSVESSAEPTWKIRLAAITKQREDERLAAAIAESKLIGEIQQPTETDRREGRQSEVDSKSALEDPIAENRNRQSEVSTTESLPTEGQQLEVDPPVKVEMAPLVNEPPDSLIVHRQNKAPVVNPPVENQPKVIDPPQPITSPSPTVNPASPTISLDTHFYDGKLIGEVSSLGMLPIGPDFDSQMEALRNIMEHYSALTGRSSQWVPYFMTILQDHHTNPQANFDPSNGVDAAQVLYNINLKLLTLLELTCIQLEEMTSGGCPQGRATRLLSVLLST